MEYQRIVGINVAPKKGAKIFTRWLLAVYPSAMPRYDERGAWTDEGNVIRQYGSEKGFSVQYAFNLASDNWSISDSEGNRKDYAGFDGNPGAFSYRGKDLGEISVKFNDASEWGLSHPEILVNGFERPTESVRKFINEQIIPSLRNSIEENHKSLRLACVKVAEQRMLERVVELREELKSAENELAHYVEKATAQVQKGASQ